MGGVRAGGGAIEKNWGERHRRGSSKRKKGKKLHDLQ